MIRNNKMDIISIASFDIGCKNFAFYIEEIDRNELESIENMDKKTVIIRMVL